jgi:toxin ParE1/3/4
MVIWTGPALRDLHDIHDYIARDSAKYARIVVSAIFERASILNQFPRIGRIVPEVHTETIRELLIYSYRIIYEIADDRIEVLTVIHGHRILDPETLT